MRIQSNGNTYTINLEKKKMKKSDVLIQERTWQRCIEAYRIMVVGSQPHMEGRTKIVIEIVTDLEDFQDWREAISRRESCKLCGVVWCRVVYSRLMSLKKKMQCFVQCSVVYCSALQCSASLSIVVQRIAAHRSVLYCSELQCIVQCLIRIASILINLIEVL